MVPTEGSPKQTGQVYITIVLLWFIPQGSGKVRLCQNVTKLSVFTVHLVVCVSFCSSFLSNPHTPLMHSSIVHSAVYYVGYLLLYQKSTARAINITTSILNRCAKCAKSVWLRWQMCFRLYAPFQTPPWITLSTHRLENALILIALLNRYIKKSASFIHSVPKAQARCYFLYMCHITWPLGATSTRV